MFRASTEAEERKRKRVRAQEAEFEDRGAWPAMDTPPVPVCRRERRNLS